MRILHVIDHIDAGGAQDILLNILRYHPEDVHNYVFFFRPIENDRLKIFRQYAECKLFVFPVILFPKVLIALVRSYKEIRPDIVHAHLEFSCLLTVLLRKILRRLVISIYSIPAQVGPLKKLTLLTCSRFADWVFVGDRIQTTYYSKVNSKISLISLGSSYKDWYRKNNKSRAQWRREFGFEPEETLLLHIGRFVPEKGHVLAMEIARELLTRGQAIKIIFIGYGNRSYYQKLIALRDTLNLTQEVIFVFTMDIYPWLYCVDGFLSTCINENMGVVIYDAVSAGLPVFSRDTGTIREVIKHGRNGLLTNSRKQLVDYIDSYFRNGARSVSYDSDKYNNEKIIPRYYQTYTHVLAN